MNTKHLIAVLAISMSSGALFAQPSSTAISREPVSMTYARNNYPVIASVSTKTRAEVIAELKQAQAQELISHRNDYPIVQTSPRAKTSDRFQVKNIHPNLSSYDTTIYAGA